MATSFTVDISNFADSGFVQVNWTNAGAGTPHYSYRVYRRIATAGAWALLYETISTSSPYIYKDYDAAVGTSYQYAVVQVTVPGGVQTEETKSPSAATGPLISYFYWLIHPTDGSITLKFRPTSDTFKEEIEQQVYKLIGRGRKVDMGTNYGKIGTLTIPLRDSDEGTAVEKRLLLDIMREEQTYLWLKTPFGDVIKVILGDITYTRIAGTGTSDYSDASFEYTEVA